MLHPSTSTTAMGDEYQFVALKARGFDLETHGDARYQQH